MSAIVESSPQRVEISYFDQNESFARQLPRRGVLAGPLTDTSGKADWYVVHLDEPISHQVEDPAAAKFRVINASQLLVRSRWSGKPIGGAAPTSVFLLLADDSQLPLPLPLDLTAYAHIAWGMCSNIP